MKIELSLKSTNAPVAIRFPYRNSRAYNHATHCPIHTQLVFCKSLIHGDDILQLSIQSFKRPVEIIFSKRLSHIKCHVHNK